MLEVSCPSCKQVQYISEGAISAICKKCKKIYDVKKALTMTGQKEALERESEKQFASDTKNICCSACQTWQEVPVIAISAFCKKCGQRINLQDYKKSGYFKGDLETKGTLFITASGEVNGNVNVGDAVIEGTFRGKLVAERLVKLQPGALFYGELFAPQLAVYDGATFVGISEVIPNKYPKKS